MPSIDDNEAVWGARYRWEERGDEWSASWGGAAMQWHGTLYPRLRAFLPAAHIVEIAPGHGRWTPFLLDHCERYTGIDLAESCVAVCAERFARDPKATFRVNDGQSLPGVGDGAADLVFSFDSLVHVEPDVIGHYLGELDRTLSPEGVAFLHHSNRGAHTAVRPVDHYAGRLAGRSPRLTPWLQKLGLVEDQHWRAPTMTAALMADMCATAGLACVGQEIINWGGRSVIDCLSVVVRAGSARDRANVVVTNAAFMAEAASLCAAQRAFGSLA